MIEKSRARLGPQLYKGPVPSSIIDSSLFLIIAIDTSNPGAPGSLAQFPTRLLYNNHCLYLVNYTHTHTHTNS